jgi:hypothetical protein
MAARFRLLSLSALLLPLMPMLGMNPALAEEPAAAASRCNNATLKGTYLYSSIGVLDGKPYAESGREVYIGKAIYPYGQNLVSFISPDGSRFTYTITRGPGERPTALSGWEIRVDP